MEDVTPSTVKQCFEKCGFHEGDDELMEDVDVDEEFSALAKELSFTRAENSSSTSTLMQNSQLLNLELRFIHWFGDKKSVLNV